ncbi:T-cell receptor beta variable [Labeo rohita]|nr:T-cell receptor beta variable [Labeo rohita]
MTLIVFTSTSSKPDYDTEGADDVIQEPEMVWEQKSGSASLNCSHKKGSAYNQMYWYRQRPGETMKLIVFTMTGISDVSQNPSVLMAVKGSSAQLNCTHKKDSTFIQMYWYRQRQGQTMTLIVFTSTSSKPDYDTEGADDVIQEPEMVWEQKSGSASLNCSHKKGSAYNQMYWYRQRPGETMKLIVFTMTGISDVSQNPSVLMAVKGSSAQLNCTHKKDFTFNQMYWYRQRQGQTMTLIVFTSTSSKPDYGSLTAACFGKTVFQLPGDLIKNEDESAVITCAHNVPNYERILWYKKDIMGFKFMGFLNLEYDNPELEFKSKIKLKGDGRKNGTLTISNLTLTDSAVYFCAAYYTVIRITSV